MNTWATKSTFVAAMLLLSGGAMAQGNYLGIAAGQGHQEIECGGAPTCDDTGTALKLTAGFAVSDNFAVELGYLDFGKVKLGGFGTTVEIKSSAITLGGAFKANFTPDFAAHARVGIAAVKAKGTISGFFNDSASDTKAKPYFGVGLSYAVSSGVAIEAGADFSKAELEGDKADIRAVTVGVRFTF